MLVLLPLCNHEGTNFCGAKLFQFLIFFFPLRYAGWECNSCSELQWCGIGITSHKVAFPLSVPFFFLCFAKELYMTTLNPCRVSPSKTPVRPRAPRPSMHWERDRVTMAFPMSCWSFADYIYIYTHIHSCKYFSKLLRCVCFKIMLVASCFPRCVWVGYGGSV